MSLRAIFAETLRRARAVRPRGNGEKLVNETRETFRKLLTADDATRATAVTKAEDRLAYLRMVTPRPAGSPKGVSSTSEPISRFIFGADGQLQAGAVERTSSRVVSKFTGRNTDQELIRSSQRSRAAGRAARGQGRASGGRIGSGWAVGGR